MNTQEKKSTNRENQEKEGTKLVSKFKKSRPPSSKPQLGMGSSRVAFTSQNPDAAGEQTISKKRSGSARIGSKQRTNISSIRHEPQSSASLLIADNFDENKFIWNGEQSF